MDVYGKGEGQVRVLRGQYEDEGVCARRVGTGEHWLTVYGLGGEEGGEGEGVD